MDVTQEYSIQTRNSPIEQLGWAVNDTWVLIKRDIDHWMQQPIYFLINLLFPVMMLLMFGYLIGGGMVPPDGGDYRAFLIPGVLTLTMFFGMESTFTTLVNDINKGVTDRFRSLPMHAGAVILGRVGADMIQSILGLAVMVVCGLLMGWRWQNGLDQALLAFGLLLLLRFSFLWLSIFLALLTHTPDAVMAVQILVWPIGFLSNIFASPDTMPAWLGAIVEWSPLSTTSNAVRLLFGSPIWSDNRWMIDYAVWLAIAWPLALFAIFFPLSLRLYKRLGH
jgi:ABC-2 type transport system permease protein